ncbi:hypothetical protein ACIOKD_17395 [Streptomyces sp. NPDC087844]|uniref:hypothetical protein n=1 Tax=Streptomyces sp. NPDC087844 TaxID=3365805 RepID=UPI00382B6B12
MDHITFLVAVVVVTALAFDFTNGIHDTANAMAVSIGAHDAHDAHFGKVAEKVLIPAVASPLVARAWPR